MNITEDIYNKEITDTYDVIGEIGKGGGGTVYEAYHKRLRKKVVLKKQHDSIRGLVNERTETDTLKNLRHSNLPQVLDFIVTDNSVYTVMDYIPGQSVKEILREKGKLSEDEVIKYAKQLCDALVYLHNSNPPVIHGDIKPDNIMVTPDDDVCLIDFNISSALGAANSYAFGYTIGYAAPEQRRSYEYERGRIRTTEILCDNDDTELLDDDHDTELINDNYDKTELIRENDDKKTAHRSSTEMTIEEKKEIGILFDKRSDIFSFGATLYHMLSGVKPSSELEKNRPIADIYPLMNRGLADIITKSMYYNPDDRFQSFDEIKKILDDIKKYDLQYKARLTRRIIIAALSAAAIGLTVGMCLITIRKKGSEKYRAGIEEALSLYRSTQYEESIGIINELDEGFYFDLPKDLQAESYYLRGADWLELNQYEFAIEDYDRALELDDGNLLVFRDKAIAYAKLGMVQEALYVVEQAKSKGMSGGDILLANAEIEATGGSKSKAIELYKQCMDQTQDPQMKSRSGLLCTQLYDLSDTGDLQDAIEVLEEVASIDSNYRLGILERLAQCYINRAEMNRDMSGYEDALNIFSEIVDKGWDTYNTHNNMAIIYEKMEKLDEAYDQLKYMEDIYGENYNTYKRLAFLEIDMQNKILGESRNYSDFKVYYEKAVRLYNSQNSINDDMEMKLLEDLGSMIE